MMILFVTLHAHVVTMHAVMDQLYTEILSFTIYS